jgi:hypothetical protein
MAQRMNADRSQGSSRVRRLRRSITSAIADRMLGSNLTITTGFPFVIRRPPFVIRVYDTQYTNRLSPDTSTQISAGGADFLGVIHLPDVP